MTDQSLPTGVFQMKCVNELKVLEALISRRTLTRYHDLTATYDRNKWRRTPMVLLALASSNLMAPPAISLCLRVSCQWF